MRKLFANLQRSPLLTHLAAIGYFTLLSVAYTYPLIWHMADSVVDAIGDNVYFVMGNIF